MKEQKVGRWLKNGYSHFKEESGLPAHVMPEHSFNRITDELGDESIMELSQPLRLADGMEDFIDEAPDPEAVPSEVWQMAVKLWPAHSQVKPVVDVCLDAAGRILRNFQSGQLTVSPVVVCRGLTVLGYAPFVPTGREITENLASILGGNADEPPGLVKRYAEAVTSGDTEIVSRVDDCIAKYRHWVTWAGLLLQQVKDFPYTPKPVGITPPLSAEIIRVLARMMKEERNNEP